MARKIVNRSMYRFWLMPIVKPLTASARSAISFSSSPGSYFRPPFTVLPRFRAISITPSAGIPAGQPCIPRAPDDLRRQHGTVPAAIAISACAGVSLAKPSQRVLLQPEPPKSSRRTSKHLQIQCYDWTRTQRNQQATSPAREQVKQIPVQFAPVRPVRWRKNHLNERTAANHSEKPSTPAQSKTPNRNCPAPAQINKP